MKINIINPNTSAGMTKKIGSTARAVALSSTKIIQSSSLHGPESIESAFDEVIASSALLDVIIEEERGCVDAHIIACLGDPAIDAAREISTVPVIGIANAAFQLATQVSYKFGIVTTMKRSVPTSEYLLQRYGYEHLCCGIRATEIPVLDLESVGNEVYFKLKKGCEKSINIDGAEAIVLGCAGMSDLASQLSLELGVPIIDGVSAAIKLAESLHQLGITICKTGQYNLPYKKIFHGRYRHLSSN